LLEGEKKRPIVARVKKLKGERIKEK